MMAKIADKLKKFERDHEIYVTADDTQFYWVLTARIPKKEGEKLHHTHRGKTYISGLNQEGNILIFPDPDLPEQYTVESWGAMNSFEEFVDKALQSILADKEEDTIGLEGGCGAECA